MYKARTATAPNPLSFSGSDVGGEIAGIQINNQSDTWLYIDAQGGSYIPPHTLAFAATFSPTVLQATVTAVASPTGGNPSQNNGTYTVTVYDVPQPPSPGLQYDTQTSLVTLQSTLNNVLAQITTVKTNTAVGGPLEVDLASIVQRTGWLNTPAFTALALHAATVVNFNTPSSSGIWLLAIQNLSSNPEKIWVADSAWSVAANVRSHGFEILPGAQRAFLMSNDYLTLVTNTVDFSIRTMTALID